MIFSGEHLISYSYSKPVTLGTHFIRLLPRKGPAQRIQQFDLNVFPKPTVQEKMLDAENNEVIGMCFSKPTRSFEIYARFRVETLLESPSSLLIDVGKLPPRRSAAEQQLLAPMLQTVSSRRVDELTGKLQRRAKDSLSFAKATNEWINTHIDIDSRRDEITLPAEDTLRSQKGASRDASWLFMTLCRRVGIPARFVSGYCFDEDIESAHERHSWAEIWIPGGGWRGFDPSLGLATSDGHIALCASAQPENTLPVQGNFTGNANATMRYDLKLSAIVDEGSKNLNENRMAG
ncbi:MAG: transglutaminase family protein [Deltaproteobacteria bacterium]|nr:transglutaminase family protein [Deltaproteobacteria bacterium]